MERTVHHGPQEARQLAAMLPSCPGCGAHNGSTDDPDTAVIRRTPKAEPLAATFPYTCGTCWTMFVGSDEEWRRMARVRETRQELATKRAAARAQTAPAAPEGAGEDQLVVYGLQRRAERLRRRHSAA